MLRWCHLIRPGAQCQRSFCDRVVGAWHAEEMTWSSEDEEGGTQTEEAAMTAALTRAFRAIDEEVIGSVCSCSILLLSCCLDCSRLRSLYFEWHIGSKFASKF